MIPWDVHIEASVLGRGFSCRDGFGVTKAAEVGDVTHDNCIGWGESRVRAEPGNAHSWREGEKKEPLRKTEKEGPKCRRSTGERGPGNQGRGG